MGLLDQVIGSALGGRGGAASPTSPLVKALLLLLAAKAVQHYNTPAPPPARPGGSPVGGGAGPTGEGGFGGVFRDDYPGVGTDAEARASGFGGSGGTAAGGLGGLGGVLAGLGTGGLGALVQRFAHHGFGDVIQSWVGPGENRPIAPNQLADALGPDTLNDLSQRTGLSREELLARLSDVLPPVVDQLTPQGRLPSEDEQRRW